MQCNSNLLQTFLTTQTAAIHMYIYKSRVYVSVNVFQSLMIKQYLTYPTKVNLQGTDVSIHQLRQSCWVVARSV